MKNEHVNECAMRAHEANRIYCLGLGDHSQDRWAECPDWQRESAVEGVKATLADPHLTPQGSHKGWTEHKLADGWVYGPTKDAEAKTHPCLVPYSELPATQQVKDAIFLAVVRSTYAICMLP